MLCPREAQQAREGEERQEERGAGGHGQEEGGVHHPQKQPSPERRFRGREHRYGATPRPQQCS